MYVFIIDQTQNHQKGSRAASVGVLVTINAIPAAQLFRFHRSSKRFEEYWKGPSRELFPKRSLYLKATSMG